MAIKSFNHLGNPKLVFGPGSLSSVAKIVGANESVFVLCGHHFAASNSWASLERAFKAEGFSYQREVISGEPSPDIVDDLTSLARNSQASLLIAIGGGSVIDAGKAVAAMVLHEGKVIQYLEGLGHKKTSAATLPLIAVPSTAGTGSEATKNAVISQRGKNAFKKSLRNDAFIPSTAIIDPELALGCPEEISFACAMDAFCQLVESYISTAANPVSDALARDGIRRFGWGSKLFLSPGHNLAGELAFRSELALAAYYSGLTLANAGLGTLHGLAGPLGAFCEIPHAMACGLLFVPVFRRIVFRLDDSPKDQKVNRRLAYTGAALLRGEGASPKNSDVTKLLDMLEDWTKNLPRLSEWGLEKTAIDSVVKDSGNKNSPVFLDLEERRSVIQEIW